MFHPSKQKGGLFILVVLVGALSVGTFAISSNNTSYEPEQVEEQVGFVAVADQQIDLFEADHIATPDPVKAIYMTSWVAGTKELRDKLIYFITQSEINAVVIDIKDYTGEISFTVDNKDIRKVGAETDRIPDIRELIDELHGHNIYVIGRLSAFQDPHYVEQFPENAVLRRDGSIWKDYKGIAWIDAGSQDMWDYLIAIAKESYRIGFDEINFDYIRFPSDGDMKDVMYPFSEGKVKHEVLKEFFAYIDTELEGANIVTSADIFGMTTTNADDLGIGQLLEDALAHFDYVAPMVYPSHYPKSFIGLSNPAEHPYEVIHYSMKKAVERATSYGVEATKLRPWLQDFDLGATYTKELVREQIQATYDVGLTSWMMWDPANRYTKEAYNAE